MSVYIECKEEEEAGIWKRRCYWRCIYPTIRQLLHGFPAVIAAKAVSRWSNFLARASIHIENINSYSNLPKYAAKRKGFTLQSCSFFPRPLHLNGELKRFTVWRIYKMFLNHGTTNYTSVACARQKGLTWSYSCSNSDRPSSSFRSLVYN